MKTLILTLLLALPLHAEELIWLPNPPTDQVERYDVEKLTDDGVQLLGATVGTNFPLGTLGVGVHTFQVKAVNAWGVSQPSLPASLTNAVVNPPGEVILTSGAVLTWSHTGDFRVFRIRVLPPGEKEWTLLATTTVNTYPVALPPAAYQFQVSASNAWDEAWSATYQSPPAVLAPGQVRPLAK